VQRSTADAALELLSTDTARQAVQLHSIGYSYAEIAVQLGLPDQKAVENLVGYQRRRLAKITPEERAG
jgi:DNA-directed RNA polymerase specialized sigma24 family protein